MLERTDAVMIPKGYISVTSRSMLAATREPRLPVAPADVQVITNHL